MDCNFKVGDKVVEITNDTYNRIGTIVSISEKRKDITVSYRVSKNGGTATTVFSTYRADGCARADVYYRSQIVPYDDKAREGIERQNVQARCRNVLRGLLSHDIDYDLAKRILEVVDEYQKQKDDSELER